MLGQTPLPKDTPSLPLQVEATSSEHVAAGRRTRLLWTGLGFAVLMLLGLAACGLTPHASHASATPARFVAFNPSLSGLVPGLLPGSTRAGPTALRSAALPRVAQRNRRQPLFVPRMSGGTGDSGEGIDPASLKSAAQTSGEGAEDKICEPPGCEVEDEWQWDEPGAMPDWTEWAPAASVSTPAPSQEMDPSIHVRKGLKNELLQRCAVCDRGFAATLSERDSIDSLVLQMKEINPSAAPAAGIEGYDATVIRGAWRLVYTSAIDVLSLAANPVSTIGGVYQYIQEAGIITNIIDILNPRAVLLLPPTVKVDSTLRLKVQTRARELSPKRIGLNFEKVTISPQKLFGNDVSFLPEPTIDLPSIPSQQGDDTPAYFDVEYVDEEMLIIRQNTAGGVDGGIFISVKVDPAREPVPFDF